MMKLILIYISILFIIVTNAYGQATTVLVTNSEKNDGVLLIKWLDRDVIIDQGVNLYRRDMKKNEWIKLNDTPILKGIFTPNQQAFDSDSTLQDFVDVSQSLTGAQLEGFVKAMLLVKTVQSNDFAQYLGIFYKDEDVKKGKTYQYKIHKVAGDFDFVTGISEPFTVKEYQAEVPPEVTQIEGRHKKVLINWKPEDIRFHGINVYRRASDTEQFVRINPKPLMISERELPNGKMAYPDEFFTDKEVENHISYQYYLTCIDFFGRESQASEIFIITPKDSKPPLPPQSLRAQVRKLHVKLSWQNRFSEDFKGMDLYRSRGLHGQRIKLNTIPLTISDTMFHDDVESPGYYYYWIAAYDNEGNEGLSEPAMADVKDVYPPVPVDGLNAWGDTGIINLSWKANNDVDLLGYRIYRTVDRNSQQHFALLNANPITDTFYIDTLPKNARNNFLYKLVSVDSSFNMSEMSEPVGARMPDVTPPEKPFIKNASQSAEGIVIEWLQNPEPDLLGYNIYRALSINDSLAMAPQQLNAGLIPATAFRFIDRFAIYDSLYNYTMVALDTSGNHSAISNNFPFKPIDFTPEASDIAIKAKATYNTDKDIIEISWNKIKSDDFLGFIVYRKSRIDDGYKAISGLSQTNEFDDELIAPAMVYNYKIVGYKTDGTTYTSNIVQVSM